MDFLCFIRTRSRIQDIYNKTLELISNPYVQCCADLVGKELRLMTLSQATDATDLLGAFEQFNMERLISSKWKKAEDRIRQIINNQSVENIGEIFTAIKKRDLKSLKCLIKCDELDEIDKLDESGNRGSFTWIDSDLVESIQQGHWIVLGRVKHFMFFYLFSR